MTKRTFFKSIMGAVAAVALAPEIAFGTRLAMPKVPAPAARWAGGLVMVWKNGDYHYEYTLRDTQREADEHLTARKESLERLQPGIKSWFIVTEEAGILSMPDCGYIRRGPLGIACMPIT